MNNKGFTLIEVVAIVIVLVAIFLVSFPSLLGVSKAEEENKYNSMVSNLCTAGKTYIYSNLEQFPSISIEGSEIEVKINLLIEYGNVDKNLKNPKTGRSVKYDTLNYIVLSDLSLDCQYEQG